MKGSFLVRGYGDSFRVLKEIKWHFIFVVGIFLLFFIIGFSYPVFFKERVADFILNLKDIFADKNLFETVLLIFFNNFQASFFAILLGIGFGIIPLIIAIINGYLIGFVSRSVVEMESGWILLRLIPHGIFELPAFLFSVSLGLKIGLSFFDSKKSMKNEVKKALKFFLFVVVPLLFIAAIIESLLIFFTK